MKKGDILKDLAASSEKRRADSSKPILPRVMQEVKIRRTSVSLTAEDLQKTYEIINIVQTATGQSVSTTHAIKIALALIPENQQAILNQFDIIMKQDGRRKKT